MKLICFGDSNTYGYDPRSYFGSRYPATCRWVDLLAEKTGWEIKNEGMNGREIPRRSMIIPEDTGLFVIMLGSNDLLQGSGAESVAEHMERFLNGLAIPKKNILLIAPPPMKLGEWVPVQSLIDASIQLAKNYRRLALRLGVRFADAGEWNISMSFDGVHFTEDGHKAFAEGLYQHLNQTEMTGI